MGRLCRLALVRGREVLVAGMAGGRLAAGQGLCPRRGSGGDGAKAVAGPDAAGPDRAAGGAAAAQIRPDLCQGADRVGGLRICLADCAGPGHRVARLQRRVVDGAVWPAGRPPVRHGLWRADHGIGLSVPVHPRRGRPRGRERRCLCHRRHRGRHRGGGDLCLLPDRQDASGSLCNRWRRLFGSGLLPEIP